MTGERRTAAAAGMIAAAAVLALAAPAERQVAFFDRALADK